VRPLLATPAFCFLLSAFCFSCKPEPVIPARPTPEQIRHAHINEAADDSAERRNLLNIARGAAVVSRSGESTLDSSVVRTIDGEPRTDWISPTDDFEQSVTFSLAARSRIDAIGASTSERLATKTIRYETSLDGKTFTPVATQTLARRYGDQLLDIKPPVDANFIRASTIDGYLHPLIDLRSVIAHGAEVAPPLPRSISGCWSLNTFPAALIEHDGGVYGWYDQRERMWLDGGFDGRVWRFVWVRGPQFGLIALTETPDNQHLSGMKFFEDADPHNVGPDLLGDRQKCTVPPPQLETDVLRTFLERHHFVPLYGLHFDNANRLLPNQSAFAIRELARILRDVAPRPVRLVSRELRGATAQEDLAVSQTRITSLRDELQRQKLDLSRVTFIAAGRADYHTAVWSEIMRTMQSGVEIEIPR